MKSKAAAIVLNMVLFAASLQVVCGDPVSSRQAQTAPVIASITINSSHGPVVLNQNSPLLAAIDLTLNESGYNFDWWVLVETPFGLFYYSPSHGYWLSTSAYDLDVSYQGAIWDFSTQILNINTSALPPGFYVFYFGVDTVMNGRPDFDKLFYDYVILTVAGGVGGVSGTWTGIAGTGQVNCTLDLIQNGSNITGVHHWPNNDNRNVYGFISGNQVALNVDNDVWYMILSSSGNTMTGTGYKPSGGTYALNFHR